jgi:signal transduction histidine kinase
MARVGSTSTSLSHVSQTTVKSETSIRRNRAMMGKGALSADHATPDFVKGMSHELHTPLNVIIGLCQVLGRDRPTTLSATQRDAVERMERNAHALLQTIDHLLACMRSGDFQ